MIRRTLSVLGALGAALVLTTAAGAQRSSGSLIGAGSSFVAPLVSAWIPKVDSSYGLKVTYGPIGSGGGIQQIINRTVDFGASDAPLTPDQFAACKGCVQIPWALSATSLAYRGDGLPNHIHLDGATVANIFLGKIKRWNDPAIKKLNKGKKLPDLQITTIHRSDNSGTSYNLTEYLNSVSKEWKSRVGKGVAVDWPTGVGARGSAGVSGTLSQTNGGITYVDVAYSLKNHFFFAAVKNRAGVYQLPGLRGITAAGKTILRVAPANGGISIVNPSKRQPLAYPISTFTYVIIPKQTSKAHDLKQFVRWTLTRGQSSGPKLLFAPIPKVVLNASLKTLNLVHA
ncbi:MAG: phosphate ABC transporter substrate-binding protein PstS [Gaiellaceae bacterium]